MTSNEPEQDAHSGQDRAFAVRAFRVVLAAAVLGASIVFGSLVQEITLFGLPPRFVGYAAAKYPYWALVALGGAVLSRVAHRARARLAFVACCTPLVAIVFGFSSANGASCNGEYATEPRHC